MLVLVLLEIHCCSSGHAHSDEGPTHLEAVSLMLLEQNCSCRFAARSVPGMEASKVNKSYTIDCCCIQRARACCCMFQMLSYRSSDVLIQYIQCTVYQCSSGLQCYVLQVLSFSLDLHWLHVQDYHSIVWAGAVSFLCKLSGF